MVPQLNSYNGQTVWFNFSFWVHIFNNNITTFYGMVHPSILHWKRHWRLSGWVLLPALNISIIILNSTKSVNFNIFNCLNYRLVCSFGFKLYINRIANFWALTIGINWDFLHFPHVSKMYVSHSQYEKYYLNIKSKCRTTVCFELYFNSYV